MSSPGFDASRLSNINDILQRVQSEGLSALTSEGGTSSSGSEDDVPVDVPQNPHPHRVEFEDAAPIPSPYPSPRPPQASPQHMQAPPPPETPAYPSGSTLPPPAARSVPSTGTDELIDSLRRIGAERPGMISGALSDIHTAESSRSDFSDPVPAYEPAPAAPDVVTPRTSDVAEDENLVFGMDFSENRQATSWAAATAVEKRRQQRPRTGWRKVAAAVVSPIGITVNKSLTEQKLDRDIKMIQTRFDTGKAIAVVSFKGGVGKSVITAGLGNTFAINRKAGTVVGIDTDEKGNLSSRVKKGQHTDRCVKTFAADPNRADPIRMHWYMVDSDTGFNVIGSSPAANVPPLTAEEYVAAIRPLKASYPLVLVDTDASAASPVFEAVMRSVDALVIVVSPSKDSVVMGQRMLQWIRENDLARLLPCTAVAINYTSTDRTHVNLQSVVTYFSDTERLKVVGIPFDDHIHAAEEIHLDLVDNLTSRRLIRLAAVLMNSMSRHGQGSTIN